MKRQRPQCPSRRDSCGRCARGGEGAQEELLPTGWIGLVALGLLDQRVVIEHRAVHRPEELLTLRRLEDRRRSRPSQMVVGVSSSRREDQGLLAGILQTKQVIPALVLPCELVVTLLEDGQLVGCEIAADELMPCELIPEGTLADQVELRRGIFTSASSSRTSA